jgi:hypothetical protein
VLAPCRFRDIDHDAYLAAPFLPLSLYILLGGIGWRLLSHVLRATSCACRVVVLVLECMHAALFCKMHMSLFCFTRLVFCDSRHQPSFKQRSLTRLPKFSDWRGWFLNRWSPLASLLYICLRYWNREACHTTQVILPQLAEAFNELSTILSKWWWWFWMANLTTI